MDFEVRQTSTNMRREGLRFQRIDAQAFRHLVIEKAFARAIRLYPLAINHELRNGALARALDDFLGSSGVVSISISVNARLCFARKRLAVRQSGHQNAE